MLLLYLAGSLLVEVAHRDAEALTLDSRPAIAAHACGDKELHIPVDQMRHCLACSPLSQRFASPVVTLIGIETSCLHVVPERDVVGLFSKPEIASSGKRGPPRA